MAADVDSNPERKELLTCPVCMEFMNPPVYQCPLGHHVCSTCKPKLNNQCPICRTEIGHIRSLPFEKFAATHHYSCRYKDTGCKLVLKYDQKRGHEKECRFRPYKCPFPCLNCAVTGDVKTLVTHLGDDHGSDVKQDYQIDTLFVHRNPHRDEECKFNVAVYSCLSEHFCLNLVAFRNPTDVVYLVFLTFMGDDGVATSFCYNLEVGNGEHKMAYQGCPRSIREGARARRNSDIGLVLHRSAAQRFAEDYNEEKLELRVKGFIWDRSWLFLNRSLFSVHGHGFAHTFVYVLMFLWRLTGLLLSKCRRNRRGGEDMH